MYSWTCNIHILLQQKVTDNNICFPALCSSLCNDNYQEGPLFYKSCCTTFINGYFPGLLGIYSSFDKAGLLDVMVRFSVNKVFWIYSAICFCFCSWFLTHQAKNRSSTEASANFMDITCDLQVLFAAKPCPCAPFFFFFEFIVSWRLIMYSNQCMAVFLWILFLFLFCPILVWWHLLLFKVESFLFFYAGFLHSFHVVLFQFCGWIWEW